MREKTTASFWTNCLRHRDKSNPSRMATRLQALYGNLLHLRWRTGRSLCAQSRRQAYSVLGGRASSPANVQCDGAGPQSGVRDGRRWANSAKSRGQLFISSQGWLPLQFRLRPDDRQKYRGLAMLKRAVPVLAGRLRYVGIAKLLGCMGIGPRTDTYAPLALICRPA
jgi:hypothetical protein